LPTKLIKPRRFQDERGWFAELYSSRTYAALGVDADFCQDNCSMSRTPGVLRGLHYQSPPHAQAKLVRCSSGRIWDVAVDIRRGSPSFGQWVSAELSAENGLQLYVPVGFAHGFVTLEPDSVVEYKTSDFYAPDCEGGLIWDDPDLAIDWPLPEGGAILSPKDKLLPRLSDIVSPFEYDGRAMAALEHP
jgi:dTDP-4-dehydrorhamnose 3,5-epimerase